ncbi:MAG TPA: hypothetical protein VE110_14260 [Gemmatimonadaceae bacterium]|nr:hypothetical protein [Gemmatimonadaceae bacterium]
MSSAIHQWAVDGIVANGMAVAEREPGTIVNSASMPALAITDSHPLASARRMMSSVRDQAGHVHELVFIPAKNGGPTASIVEIVNGKIAQAYSYDWKKTSGGWVAKGFAASVFRDGKPIATVRSGSKLVPGRLSNMVTSDDPCMFDAEYAATSGNCDGAPTLGGGGGSGSGGTGTSGCTCTDQAAKYLAAELAVGMSTANAIEAAAVSPYTLIALGGAWAYVGYLLLSYESCMQACQSTQPVGSAGGGGSGFVVWADRSSP